jgi:hypothetical protein
MDTSGGRSSLDGEGLAMMKLMMMMMMMMMMTMQQSKDIL